jgi:hypothetical protein
MELKPEDIQFLSNDESWMYGPTYDLELVIASDSAQVCKDAVSSFPSMIAWADRRNTTRSIVCTSDINPFGLFHYCRESGQSLTTYRLVIYPQQMLYACGQEIWEQPKTAKNILALQHLHAVLLELTRWVNAHVRVVFASVFDETYSPLSDLSEDHFWVQADVAAAIGWSGRKIGDWTGILL